MAWSTAQLADLAGTTVKAVRHYHSLGLLDEPERASNGYKQYQVAHLVRLLQIKRLSDLGMPLADVATLERADEAPDEAIRVLDAELAATIDRLERIRAELAIVMRHRASIDLPSGFGSVADGLSETDRAMLLVYSRVVDDEAMGEFQGMLSTREPLDDEFDAIEPDADEATILSLAARLAPVTLAMQEAYPAVKDPARFARKDEGQVVSTMTQAIGQLYNPAQLRVLYEMNLILVAAAEAEEEGAER